MSTKFGFRAGVHIAGFLITLLIIFIALGVSAFSEKSNFDVIFPICISITLFGILNNFFTYYVVTERDLVLKSIIKHTNIEWNEVECIMEQQAGKFVSLSVGVFSSRKRISITPWTKDYKNLLQLIIEKSRTNKNVKIDPRVLDIIK